MQWLDMGYGQLPLHIKLKKQQAMVLLALAIMQKYKIINDLISEINSC
jgi:hypothetical protein